MDALIDKIRQGDRRCLARAMSLVDSAGPEARRLRDLVRPHTGRMPWWGFTGPPGVGKSALIDALLGRLREHSRRVAVVAVDPTSPLSGGALLGDRVRMMRHAVDPDVFIRSLATHGRAGGLSDATLHCARLLELAGFEPVLIETIGVGQNEADVAEVVDLCVVVLAPGYGDDIQLIKAGLLEIADLIVVNKCDLPDANRLLSAVRHELSARSSGERRTEVLPVSAKSGDGVDELLDRLLALDQAARDQEHRDERQQRRLLAEIRHSAMSTYEDALRRGLADGTMRELARRLARGEVALDSVVTQLSAAVAGLQEQEPVTPEHPSSQQEGGRG
jgi:LAO/AO transport system kinase